jgi:hypothetical protein
MQMVPVAGLRQAVILPEQINNTKINQSMNYQYLRNQLGASGETGTNHHHNHCQRQTVIVILFLLHRSYADFGTSADRLASYPG